MQSCHNDPLQYDAAALQRSQRAAVLCRFLRRNTGAAEKHQAHRMYLVYLTLPLALLRSSARHVGAVRP